MNVQRMVSIALLVLTLSACRREAPQQAVPTATITPTPYSTALPPVATIIPPGSETRALQMVVYSDSASTGTSAATRIEAALLNDYGLNVEVLIRERYAEVLAALCNSGSGQVSVVWLDGITYAAARAQQCGTPALLVERDDAIGGAVEIIVNAAIENDNLIALRESKYCRLNYNDFATWLAPSLVFRANGLNPVTAFESISDFADMPALLQAVAEGECEMTSVPAGTLDDTDFADLLDDLRVIETSIAFPYNILMIPIEVPLDIRLQFIRALRDIAADSSMSRTLSALLGQDALVPLETDTLDEFHEFIDGVGLDFAQMGS
jgi:ABC-type phosphate/phosphonate transport system substrate-binding protein